MTNNGWKYIHVVEWWLRQKLKLPSGDQSFCFLGWYKRLWGAKTNIKYTRNISQTEYSNDEVDDGDDGDDDDEYTGSERGVQGILHSRLSS